MFYSKFPIVKQSMDQCIFPLSNKPFHVFIAGEIQVLLHGSTGNPKKVSCIVLSTSVSTWDDQRAEQLLATSSQQYHSVGVALRRRPATQA